MLETINKLAIELYGVPVEQINDEDIWAYLVQLAEKVQKEKKGEKEV